MIKFDTKVSFSIQILFSIYYWKMIKLDYERIILNSNVQISSTGKLKKEDKIGIKNDSIVSNLIIF